MVCENWEEKQQVPPLRYAPVEKHFQERSAELQIRPLRYPGFPVGLGGVGRSHVPFLKRKAHTRLCPVPRGRKSGFTSVLMTQRGRWVSIGDRWQGSQVSKARPGAPFDFCRHSELSNCTPDSPTEFAAPEKGYLRD
jgi:hypothetical protein